MDTWLTTAERVSAVWLDWMRPMAWQVALMATVILGVALLARKASPRFRYFLWCLVLAKLCLPPTLAFVTGMGQWALPQRATPAAFSEPEMTTLPEFDEYAGAGGATASAFLPVEGAMPPAVAVVQAAPSAEPAFHLPLPVALLGIWLVGVAALFALFLIQHRRVGRLLGTGRPVTDEALLRLLDEARAALGVRARVALVSVEALHSPILFGAFRPRIAIPRRALESLPPEQIRPILLHELAHLKRKDLWWNFGQMLVQLAYWFHPFVWLANRQLRRERELIVDDIVLAKLQGGRESYSASLLSILKHGAQRQFFTPAYVGIVETPGSLAHRLKRILDANRKLSLRLGWAGLIAVVALGLVLIPQGKAKEKEVAPTPAPSSLGLTGIVRGPNGAPVAGAQVMIVAPVKLPTYMKMPADFPPMANVSMIDGQLGSIPSLKEAKTGQDGKFTFEQRPEMFGIMVAHASGYAEIPPGRLSAPLEITLQPWATVKGTVSVRSKPAAGFTVTVMTAYVDDVASFCRQVSCASQAKTDERGAFEVKCVPEGMHQITAYTPDNGPGAGGGDAIMAHMLPGETREVQLGGQGRPLKGQFTVPAGTTVDWSQSNAAIASLGWEDPVTPQIRAQGHEATLKFLREWRQTPEGRSRRVEHRFNVGGLLVKTNGGFSVEDIPPGNYTMYLAARTGLWTKPDSQWPDPDGAAGSAFTEFVIAPFAEAQRDIPYELPPIEIRPVKSLTLNDEAPPLEIETTDGRRLSLKQFRGRYVLLNFLVPQSLFSDFDLQQVKKVFAAYGEDQRLTLVSLVHAREPQLAAEYARRVGITWLCGRSPGAAAEKDPFLDPAYRYGLDGGGATFLIGPDGRIVARYIHGEEILMAVEAALKKPLPPTATPPAPRFEGTVFINNVKYGPDNGARGPLGPTGKMSCGQPPDGVSDVTWQFKGDQNGKDVYVFERRFPANGPTPATERKEVAYAGEEVTVFKDETQKIVILPPTPPDYSTMLESEEGLRAPTAEEVAKLGALWPKAPPEKNAAYYYAEASNELVESYKRTPEPPGSLSQSTPYDGDAAGFIKYVEENSRILAAVQDSLAKYPFGAPVGIRKETGSPLPAMRLLAQVRHVVRFLSDAGFAAELQGQPALAAERYLDNVRMGKQLRHESLLMTNLVGLAIQAVGGENLEPLVATAPLDEPTLRRIIAVCHDAETTADNRLAVLRREEALAKAAMAISPRLTATYGKDYDACLVLMEKELAKPLPELLRSAEANAKAVADKYPAQRDGALEYLATMPQKWARQDLDLRVLQTRAAIALYEKQRGAPPDSLTALVPRFLPEVPEDPFFGKPLHYARTGDGWKLWSVGYDLKDDGGELAYVDQKGWIGPDFVYTSKVRSNIDRRSGGKIKEITPLPAPAPSDDQRLNGLLDQKKVAVIALPGVTLPEAVEILKAQVGKEANFQIDPALIQGKDLLITVDLRDVTLRTLLTAMLRPHGLEFAVWNDVIYISTPKGCRKVKEATPTPARPCIVDLLPAEDDYLKGPWRWKITPGSPVQVMHGWYTVVEGRVAGNVATGNTWPPHTAPLELGWSATVEGNMLLVTREEARHDATVKGNDKVSGKVEIPPDAVLRADCFPSPDTLGMEARTLWRGDFVRDGKIVKSVIFAAHLAAPDDKGAMFRPPESGWDEPVTQPQGLTAANQAFWECMQKDASYSSAIGFPPQKEAIAAWSRFLERDDLTKEMRVFAHWRIGSLYGYNLDPVAGEKHDFERSSAAMLAALAVDPQLISAETLNARTIYASSSESTTERAHRSPEQYRFVMSIDPAWIDASAERVDGNGRLTPASIQPWATRKSSAEKRQLLLWQVQNTQRVLERGMVALAASGDEEGQPTREYLLKALADIATPDLLKGLGNPAPTPAFGPVIERTVNHSGADCLIDLDTGKLFPGDIPEAIRAQGTKAINAWVAEQGIDAGGGMQPEIMGLIGFDLIVFPMPNEDWDRKTPQSLLIDRENAFKPSKPGNPIYLGTKGVVPATWIFQTREGAVGILQVVGFTDNHKGVKIRYKMVSAQKVSIETADGHVTADKILRKDDGTIVLEGNVRIVREDGPVLTGDKVEMGRDGLRTTEDATLKQEQPPATPTKSAIETVREFTSATDDGDISRVKMCYRPGPDAEQRARRDVQEWAEMRKLNPEWSFGIVSAYWNADTALVVSNALRGDPKNVESHAVLVLTLKRWSEGERSGWGIEDVDLEPLEGLQREIEKFLGAHPDCRHWSENTDPAPAPVQ